MGDTWALPVAAFFLQENRSTSCEGMLCQHFRAGVDSFGDVVTAGQDEELLMIEDEATVASAATTLVPISLAGALP